jgi:hypothetical protein
MPRRMRVVIGLPQSGRAYFPVAIVVMGARRACNVEAINR